MRERSDAPRGTRRLWREIGWLPLIVALATAVVFAPAIGNQFTKWDDPPYVTENYQIRELSASRLFSLFSTFLVGNYHPLTAASLAVDYHLWGLNPKGYHITNVVLHVANALAVFVFVFLLTGSRAVSLITSLFFGIHPLHVESVAWVSARKDLLYTLFYLGACACYLLWLKGGSLKWRYYAGALALFLLSLLSKGMAVTLPLALLLIDFYFQRREKLRRILLEKIPFFFLSLLFGGIAIVAQRVQGAMGDFVYFPLHERVLFACHGFLSYLFKAFVPIKLSAFYPYPDRVLGDLAPIYSIGPPLVAILVWAAYLSRSRERGVVFGALFYTVNVALVLQWIPVGKAIMADRYTYLSYVGIGFLLGIGYHHLAHGPLAARRNWRPALALPFLTFFLILGFAARARCAVWRDNVTLWTDVLRKYPHADIAYKNRALSYKERGDYGLAMNDLEQALAIRPNDAEALRGRGNLYFARGDAQQALADLDEAVRRDPSLPDTWNSRGAVLATLGKHEQALADFNKAIELKKDFADAYLNRANTRLALGRYEPALSDYETYLAWEPGSPRGYFCRGLAKLTMGDAAGAIKDFGVSLKLKPDFGLAYFFRSKAYSAQRQFEDALRDALEARARGFSVDPGYLEALKRAETKD